MPIDQHKGQRVFSGQVFVNRYRQDGDGFIAHMSMEMRLFETDEEFKNAVINWFNSREAGFHAEGFMDYKKCLEEKKL